MSLTHLARKLRKKQTDAEQKLWWALRSRQLKNIKFRRQQPIGRYIVDFVSFEKRLIIELDGSQHLTTQKEDAQRTIFLKQSGFEVLRFWDNEVFDNFNGILEDIVRAVKD